jgi:hypothetical protein
LAKNDKYINQRYYRHFGVEVPENIESFKNNTAIALKLAENTMSCKSTFKAMAENERKPSKGKYGNLSQSGHFGMACARHEVGSDILD